MGLNDLKKQLKALLDDFLGAPVANLRYNELEHRIAVMKKALMLKAIEPMPNDVDASQKPRVIETKIQVDGEEITVPKQLPKEPSETAKNKARKAAKALKAPQPPPPPVDSSSDDEPVPKPAPSPKKKVVKKPAAEKAPAAEVAQDQPKPMVVSEPPKTVIKLPAGVRMISF